MAKYSQTTPPNNSTALRKIGKREAAVLASASLNMHNFLYDFSVDGGAVGTISFKNLLPKNAVVVRLYSDVQTVVTSGGSATIKIVAGSTDLTTAQAFSTEYDDLGPHLLTLASSAVAIKPSSSASSELKLVIGTAALTAGKVRISIEYFISP